MFVVRIKSAFVHHGNILCSFFAFIFERANSAIPFGKSRKTTRSKQKKKKREEKNCDGLMVIISSLDILLLYDVESSV